GQDLVRAHLAPRGCGRARHARRPAICASPRRRTGWGADAVSAGRRVVVTQRLFDTATIAYLEAQGCEVALADLPPGKGDGDLTREELETLLAGAAGWIVGHARVTRELLAALPELRIVSRRGVGYERVD